MNAADVRFNQRLREVEARDMYTQARFRWLEAKTKKAKRDAADDMEFWGNKMAYIGVGVFVSND
jgi:hypothetical protein